MAVRARLGNARCIGSRYLSAAKSYLTAAVAWKRLHRAPLAWMERRGSAPTVGRRRVATPRAGGPGAWHPPRRWLRRGRGQPPVARAISPAYGYGPTRIGQDGRRAAQFWHERKRQRPYAHRVGAALRRQAADARRRPSRRGRETGKPASRRTTASPGCILGI